LFPCNFQTTAMASQCLPSTMHTESLFSIIDGKWISRFAWNHQWEGGQGLGGTCASCRMDTPK
jgi:hypothetical protein